MSDGGLVRLYGHHPEVSDGFRQWLDDEGVSVLFASGGRIWVIGRAPDGRVDAEEHGFGSPVTAVAASGDSVLVATWQVWRFVNGLEAGVTTVDGHDRLLLPQMGMTVGNVGICDLFEGPDGVVFASSRLGCLAIPDQRWSFQPIWMPPWQSALVDEDRSHLGGATAIRRIASGCPSRGRATSGKGGGPASSEGVASSGPTVRSFGEA